MNRLSADPDEGAEGRIGQIPLNEILVKPHPTIVTDMVNSVKLDISSPWCWNPPTKQGRYAPMQNRIRELREERKLTLEDVAARIGTTVQQISRLERGERKLTDTWMRAIAEALEVSPASLSADFLPDQRTFAENAEEELLLRQWRCMELDDRIYLAETLKRMGLAKARKRRIGG